MMFLGENKMTDVLGIDYEGRDWFHIKSLLKTQIQDYTDKLVGDLSERETDKIRGCILCCKTILQYEDTARERLAHLAR